MGGFYITENFKTYEFEVGPQSFDNTIFKYELRIGFRGTHMVLPTLYHQKQGEIQLKDVKLDGGDVITSLKKIQNGKVVPFDSDVGEFSINTDFTDIVINLTDTTKKVSFQAKSKYGIDMAHVYLVLRTDVLPQKGETITKVYITQAESKTPDNSLPAKPNSPVADIGSQMSTDEKQYVLDVKSFSQIDLYNYRYGNDSKKSDTVLSKLKNSSTVFDLNNIDKFNFGIFKLSNYFVNRGDNQVRYLDDLRSTYDNAPYDSLSSNDDAKKLFKGLQCDANNIFTINGSKVITRTEYQEGTGTDILKTCQDFRTGTAQPLNTEDDWFIYSRWSSTPAIYKFSRERFDRPELNIKFNIPYIEEILNKNINSIIPAFELHIHLSEQKSYSPLDQDLARDRAMRDLSTAVIDYDTAKDSDLLTEKKKLTDEIAGKINNVDKLFIYNELEGEYDKLMSQKDKILKQNQNHELILRSSQNIQKKIGFYNQQIKKLKLVTMIVHIILAVIIIVALVYQEIARRS